MVDRQQLYCSYALSHARRSVPENVDPPLAAAAALGVQDARGSRELRTIAEVEAEVRRLETSTPDAGAILLRELEQAKEALEHARAKGDELARIIGDTRAILEASPNETTVQAARRVAGSVPDVGPTDRDIREREDAQARLRRLVTADGVTCTGGRWLHDAAADEIVRLRGVVSTQNRCISSLDEGARAGYAVTHRGVTVTAPETMTLGDVWAALTDAPALSVCLRGSLARAREQGAAEMRERAAGWCAGLATKERSNIVRLALEMAAYTIRTLALDGAPTRGIAPWDADTLRRAGWTVNDGRWAKPGCEVLREDVQDHVVRLVAVASDARAKAPALTQPEGLSAEDAETLRGAGWTEDANGWRGWSGLWVANATNIGSLRKIAADIRAKKAPVAAHGEPGKATGGDHAATGQGSVAGEQGAAQAPCEPTARDAVAGMLLRHGRMLVADALAKGLHLPGDVAKRMRDTAPPGSTDPQRDACIAALEALARDELRVLAPGDAAGHSLADLIDLRRRIRIELGAGEAECTARAAQRVYAGRDAALAEAKALREELERTKRCDDGSGPVREGQPGTETVFDVNRKTRLTFPRGADAREVLATVAELLGLAEGGHGGEEQAGASLRDRARAAGAEEQRVTPEGFTQLPSAMLSTLGLEQGGFLWFLRGSPGGRWEAWREQELDVALGLAPAEADTVKATGAPDREALGRAAHGVWVSMAQEEAAASQSATWDELEENAREEHRRLGERLFAMGARHGRAQVKALVQRWNDMAGTLLNSSTDDPKGMRQDGRAQGLFEAAGELEAALSGPPRGHDGCPSLESWLKVDEAEAERRGFARTIVGRLLDHRGLTARNRIGAATDRYRDFCEGAIAALDTAVVIVCDAAGIEPPDDGGPDGGEAKADTDTSSVTGCGSELAFCRCSLCNTARAVRRTPDRSESAAADRQGSRGPSPAAIPEAPPELVGVYVCRRDDCEREGKATYRADLQGAGWCENCGRALERTGAACVVPSAEQPEPTAPETPEAKRSTGSILGTLWRLPGAPTHGAYEVAEHAMGRVRLVAQYGDASTSMHEAELRSLWQQVDAAVLTPPAERYAGHGQDGGDVPAGEACGTCDGSGQVDANDYTGNLENCPECDGPPERATPPIASAAPAVPESARDGAGASLRPWRGIVHEVEPLRRACGARYVDAYVNGDVYSARFQGPNAEERAREYAAWVSAPPAPLCSAVLLTSQDNARDNGPWCATHGARFDVAPEPPQKPGRVEASQVWRCVGIDGELDVVERAGETGVGLAPAGSADVAVRATEQAMLALKEWTFVRNSR